MAESKIIPCPIPGLDGLEDDKPVYFVAIPGQWLGAHTLTYDTAVKMIAGKGYSDAMATFAVSLALADNFNLPGLTGKPDAWDFSQIDLRLMAWVNAMVYADYNNCFEVKKNYYNPYAAALKAIQKATPVGT